MRNPNFEREKFWTPLHKTLDPPLIVASLGVFFVMKTLENER